MECKVANHVDKEDALKCVLIETLWNVKFKEFYIYYTILGINRNIVECKDASLVTTMFAFATVLIETLWNVKFCIKQRLQLSQQY